MDVVLVIASLIIIYTDVKHRIISNKITLPLIVFGLTFQFYYSSLPGIANSLLGLLIGFIVYFFPYIKGWMGGGDVKFAVALGAALGPVLLINVLVLTSIIGMLYALLVMAREKQLWYKLKNIFLSILWFTSSKGKIKLHIIENGKQSIPYGVFLSIGTILTTILQRSDLVW